MRKRTDLKPADFVRCHRCGRLAEKSKSTRFRGVVYGSECITYAMSASLDGPLDEALPPEESSDIP